MDAQTPSPKVRSFIPAALICALLGWSGLVALLIYTEPNGGTRWAFFFCAVLGLTGLVLPFVAYLNRRFPSTPPVTHGIVMRQAVWIGIYLPTLAWLLSRDRTGAYRYLHKSVLSFCGREEIVSSLKSAGFSDVAVYPLSWGIVAIYVAYKAGV